MNIRKFLLFFICLCCIDSFLYAQDYNKRPEFLKVNGTWVFSGYSGMNFNTNPPQAFTAGLSGSIGCASVASPKTGNLLFYTDGRKIYNKNNTVMPNGTLINSTQLTSPYEGVCIVPMIDSPGKYYVFTVETPSYSNRGVLRYSIVDTTLNGGLGDIVAGRKDVYVDSVLTHSVLAVPGDNCDIWLVVHRRDTSLFKTYHITRHGLNTTPVTSNVGPMYGKPPTLIRNFPTMVSSAYGFSGMAISPSRKKIAIYSKSMHNLLGLTASRPYLPNLHGILLCDFDPATGSVSNGLRIDSNVHHTYLSMCFSPDNSKLYMSAESDTAWTYTSFVYQYDVSTRDSQTIRNSMTQVLATENSGTAFKLYNDTIYLAGTAVYLRLNNTTYTRFARINNPNKAGLACNLQDTIATLTVDGIGYALPSDVVLPQPSDTMHTRVLDTLFCKPFNMKLQGRPGFNAYEWSTGSTDTGITVTQQSTYWVKSKDYCHSFIDTFVITGTNLPPASITVNGYQLGTASSYTSYQWYLNGVAISNETNATYDVKANGIYSVKVSNGLGCYDSVAYTVTNYVGISSLPELQQAISVYPNPAKTIVHIVSPVAVNATISTIDGRKVSYLQNVDQIDIAHLAEGIYLLHITNSSNQLIRTEKLVKIK